jgi:hypothetical protein
MNEPIHALTFCNLMMRSPYTDELLALLLELPQFCHPE